MKKIYQSRTIWVAIIGLILTILGQFNIKIDQSADEIAGLVVKNDGVNWLAIASFVLMIAVRFATDGALVKKDWWKSKSIWVAISVFFAAISQGSGVTVGYPDIGGMEGASEAIGGVNFGGVIAALSMVVMRTITTKKITPAR